MKRVEDRVDPVRSKFGSIKKEEVSLEDKMVFVNSYAKSHKSFSFRTLLMECHTKTEVVVTFLVILEMMKAGEIMITQEHTFDDIAIESKIAA